MHHMTCLRAIFLEQLFKKPSGPTSLATWSARQMDFWISRRDKYCGSHSCTVWSIMNMLVLVLKCLSHCTVKCVEWTSGARVRIHALSLFNSYFGRVIAQSSVRSIARSITRSFDRLAARSNAREISRSLARSGKNVLGGRLRILDMIRTVRISIQRRASYLYSLQKSVF